MAPHSPKSSFKPGQVKTWPTCETTISRVILWTSDRMFRCVKKKRNTLFWASFLRPGLGWQRLHLPFWVLSRLKRSVFHDFGGFLVTSVSPGRLLKMGVFVTLLLWHQPPFLAGRGLFQNTIFVVVWGGYQFVGGVPLQSPQKRVFPLVWS